MKLSFIIYKYFPFGGQQRDFLCVLNESSKGHPRNPPGPLLAPQLSGQSVPGQLSGYVAGFWDPPTSPGVGLGGVTCSGFGSAASAEGLSILCIYIIHT